jgi:hypothetical protein
MPRARSARLIHSSSLLAAKQRESASGLPQCSKVHIGSTKVYIAKPVPRSSEPDYNLDLSYGLWSAPGRLATLLVSDTPQYYRFYGASMLDKAQWQCTHKNALNGFFRLE